VARTSIWPRLRPSVRRMTTRCSFGVIEGGAVRITSRTAPVIAVPTTAGTGSEVGRSARRTSSAAWPRRWARPAGPRWGRPCAS
jgi:hypothetical protein